MSDFRLQCTMWKGIMVVNRQVQSAKDTGGTRHVYFALQRQLTTGLLFIVEINLLFDTMWWADTLLRRETGSYLPTRAVSTLAMWMPRLKRY